MPNFNFNINNIKEGSEPILMAARTAQSMSRKNSISALAKDLIMQYPVLISRSISVENALIVTKGLERQFAALQMLVLSADSAFGVDPGKNAGVRDLISKYHSNADTPDMINFAGNVIDNLGTVSKHFGSLESAETNTENAEVKIKAAHTVNIAVDKDVLATLRAVPSDYINMESVNNMYQPHKVVIDTVSSIADGIESRNTVATEGNLSSAASVFTDLANDLNKNNPTGFDVNKTIQRQKQYQYTKTGKNKDGSDKWDLVDTHNDRTTTVFDRQKQVMDTAKTVRIEKEYTALEPTILEVEFYITQGDNSRIQKSLIGISANPHVIPDDVMRANIIKSLQYSHKGFNFIQYTKGELKFVRDFLFNIKRIKEDAMSKNHYDKWFAALRKRKNNAKAFNAGNTGKSGVINPISTLVVTSEDVAAIKATSNFDLTNPATAMKLMDSLYLLCFIIVDENTNMISTMLDGQRDFMDTTLAAMKKSNNNQSLNYANPKELLGLLGRLS